MALAGPAVTLAIAAAFGAVALSGALDAVPALRGGGRLPGAHQRGDSRLQPPARLPARWRTRRPCRAVVATGDRTRATVVAAAIGRAFGYVFVAFGALNVLSGAIGGLWLVLVGLFIVAAGAAEVWQARVHDRLRDVTVSELMSHPPVCLSTHERTLEALRRPSTNGRFGAFPVVDTTGRVTGVASLAALRRAAMRRPVPTVGDTTDHDPELLVSADRRVLEVFESAAFERSRHAVIVDDAGRPIGVLSIRDIDRAARTPPAAGRAPRRQLPGAGPSPAR